MNWLAMQFILELSNDVHRELRSVSSCCHHRGGGTAAAAKLLSAAAKGTTWIRCPDQFSGIPKSAATSSNYRFWAAVVVLKVATATLMSAIAAAVNDWRVTKRLGLTMRKSRCRCFTLPVDHRAVDDDAHNKEQRSESYSAWHKKMIMSKTTPLFPTNASPALRGLVNRGSSRFRGWLQQQRRRCSSSWWQARLRNLALSFGA